MKQCTRCGGNKPLTELKLNKRMKDGRDSWCKECYSAYQREWRGRTGKGAGYSRDFRARNPERAAELVRVARSKLEAERDSRKTPCVCCGESRLACIDFHHVNPADKEFAPGYLVRKSMNQLKTELDKCITLCANCHRLFHAGEPATVERVSAYLASGEWTER